MYDFRHLNFGRWGSFTAFWDAAKAFLKKQVMAAVDSRRHGQVYHMAAALSIHDLIEQVKKRQPGVEVPSELLVRLQF